eukprot:CAMPEP_0196764726 /NCGR_PEP_ID=MMETSP1095-20130614/6725_1 /TAXON_ID=96789 ORGANISM="Chromulina nebulosa, Strain UTEXLB2642" /NCGR_SAMPLE_ID=MMETSP1095 /ASSEMBLY_ACC=CAM_ASM_000446 /LENGTH=783 /DNA_ID=CAMNT_0042121011 /DNA_START=430 /DNA_END=2782 /DNA_ORIENTATION=+
MKKVIDQYDIILDDSEYDTTTDASNTNTERNNDMEISKQNEISDDSFIALDQTYHLYEITFAISYGINPSNNDHARYLMPVVVDYLYNLPDGFKLYLGKNEYENVPFFFNQIRQESVWTHPNDIEIKEKLEDIRKEYNLELIDDNTLYELSHIQDMNDSNRSKPSSSNIPLDPVIEETHDEFDADNDINKVPLPLSPRPLTRGESLFSPKVSADLSVSTIPPGTLSKRGSSFHSVRSPKITKTSSLSFNIIDESKLNSARSRSSVSMSSKSLDNKDDISISNSSSITPVFVPISKEASPTNISNHVISSKIESFLNSNVIIDVNEKLGGNVAVLIDEKIDSISSEDNNNNNSMIDNKLDNVKASEISNNDLSVQDIEINDQKSDKKNDDISIIKPSMSRTTSYKDKRLVVSIDRDDIDDTIDSNTSSSIYSSVNEKTINSSIGLSSKYLSDFSTPEASINSPNGLSSKYVTEINTPNIESYVSLKDDKLITAIDDKLITSIDDKVITSIDDNISTSSTTKRKLSIDIKNPSDKPIVKSVKHIDPIFDNLSSAHSDDSFSSYVSYGSDDSYSSYTGSSRLPTSRSDFYLLSSRSKMGDRSFQYNSTSKSDNETTPKTLLDNIVNSDDNGSVNSVEGNKDVVVTVRSNEIDIIDPLKVELNNQRISPTTVTVGSVIITKVDKSPRRVSPKAFVDAFVPISTDVTPKHKPSKSSLESPKSSRRSFSPKRASPKTFQSPRTIRSIDKTAVTMILEGTEEDISRANTPAVPIILDIYTNTLSDESISI